MRKLQMVNGFGQLIRKIGTNCRCAGGIIPVPGAFHLHFTQNHFRVGDEIAVHCKAVLILPQLYPFRVMRWRCFPFLQKYDIRCYFCARIGFERIVGQTDRTQQIRFLRKQAAHMRVFLIHCAFGCDKRDNSIRLYLIQRFNEEIIMDQ